MLSLRLDCIRGLNEVPKLYIHRAKRYKERYIPLVDSALKIVNEMQSLNLNSLPIYLDYDKETHQRLFNNKGIVMTLDSLQKNFQKIMIRNGIVDNDNNAKYSPYILRRIRITTWLESGMSQDEVAYLVGHDEVDSHNNYIVSKEIRIENAKKVYKKHYEGFIKNVESGEAYTTELMPETNEDYCETLKNTLIEIESKNINKALLEEALKNFPQFAIDIPCGICAGKAIFDEGFECEAMRLPCLECNELISGKEYIKEFDKIADRMIKRLAIYEANGIFGLKMRTESILERLARFYVARFELSIEEVNLKFEAMRKTVKKRKKICNSF